jgi:hypothetical protein
MQVERFGGCEKGSKAIGTELLKFTTERLPQYGWLEKTCLPEESPTTGGGVFGEWDFTSA